MFSEKSTPSVAGDSYTDTTLPAAPTLRDYQKKAVEEIVEISILKQRTLVYAPTGAGKTIIAAASMERFVKRGERNLFCVANDCLVSQTLRALDKFDLLEYVGVIKSGWKENRNAPIQIASLQSMLPRPWWRDYNPDNVFWDECHRTAFFSMADAIEEQCPDAAYYGLTATPWRSKNTESMGDKFDHLIFVASTLDLIRDGHLVKPIVYSADGIDQNAIDSIDTSSGDFDERQLSLVCNTEEAILLAIASYKKICYGRLGLYYAVNVQHSKDACAAFNAAGIPAGHIDGKTPTKEREALIEQLWRGEIRMLCSCAALQEGFDCPPVSCIIDAHPTKTISVWIQRIGRGIRTHKGKTECIVLDQAANSKRFSPIEDITREHIHLDKSDILTPGVSPLKECPSCRVMIRTFEMTCPHCGYEYPPKAKPLAVQELEMRLNPTDKAAYTFLRQKVVEGWNDNRHPGWAWHRFKDRHGYLPPKPWFFGAIFGYEPHPSEEELYASYLDGLGLSQQDALFWLNCEFSGGDR